MPLNYLQNFLTTLLIALSANLPAIAQTQSYPNKPITLIVGYPPGGSTDMTGRAVAAELTTRLGVSVVVENIGGAGGAIGAQKVASAAPDGYTLLLGANNEIAINKLVTQTVKYEISDFTPIGIVSSQAMVLVASSKTGVKNVDEFLTLTKKNPGKFSYGSSGVGTSLHLAGELVKQQAGLFMTHIPYRGVAPLTNDLVGSNIEFGVFVLSSGLPHIRSGRVIALGTTELKRSASTPEIPALAEHPKLKGFNIGSWFALMAPAKLPEAVFAKLKKALNDTLESPDFRKKMEASSSTVAASNLDAEKFILSEIEQYKKIVKFANIKE